MCGVKDDSVWDVVRVQGVKHVCVGSYECVPLRVRGNAGVGCNMWSIVVV